MSLNLTKSGNVLENIHLEQKACEYIYLEMVANGNPYITDWLKLSFLDTVPY